jgi:hypothetical protein
MAVVFGFVASALAGAILGIYAMRPRVEDAHLAEARAKARATEQQQECLLLREELRRGGLMSASGEWTDKGCNLGLMSADERVSEVVATLERKAAEPPMPMADEVVGPISIKRPRRAMVDSHIRETGPHMASRVALS